MTSSVARISDHIVLLCLALFLMGGANAEAPLPPNDLSPSPSKPASPDQWWLRSLDDGKDILFSQFKGKVIFLNFWATWCGPCLQEMPAIERMYQKLKGKDIVVLVVANQNPNLLRPYF